MIKVAGVKKSFGVVEVLKGVDLHIEKSKVVSIMGASGAGKSTLLQIIGGLLTPDSGKVEVDGWQIDELSSDKAALFRNKSIGFVFQAHNLLPEFTALENVMIPAMIGGISRKESEQKAMAMLKHLSMEHRADNKPSALSGGEAQRVAIARALVNSPNVLLADEPSGNLDTKNRDQLHKLFMQLRQDLGITIVFVTHDEHLASMSDYIITISDGVILSKNKK
ncbi:MAG: ABC transporter ATP-binding protein [Rikenellaceae bacterium]